jgi:hypothetical protein
MPAADKRISVVRAAMYFGTVIALTTSFGCSLTGGSRIRVGYLPTATFGVLFADPNNLGTHSSGIGFPDRGGIVYTCKGGHIDIDHVRGNADNTRYLVNKLRKALSKQKKAFNFHITGERQTHKVKLTYPKDWKKRPDKEKIIDEIAFDTAPYLAFDATIWHEIGTWFGVHYALIEPEFNSAFSWEDIYSNLLGTQLGIEAMKDTEHSYDEAMTEALNRRLKELGIQSKSTAIAASDKVRGQWYTGNFVPDVKMRNFDIGLDDGMVTPTLVPSVDDCHSKPLPLPVPTLDTLKRYGFSLTYEIKPNLLFEQGRIFKAAGSKRIFPEIHFPILIEYMKQKAAEKGYKYGE